jgi:hypothetical protein
MMAADKRASARSESEIRMLYPELVIFQERPTWMKAGNMTIPVQVGVARAEFISAIDDRQDRSARQRSSER